MLIHIGFEILLALFPLRMKMSVILKRFANLVLVLAQTLSILNFFFILIKIDLALDQLPVLPEWVLLIIIILFKKTPLKKKSAMENANRHIGLTSGQQHWVAE